MSGVMWCLNFMGLISKKTPNFSFCPNFILKFFLSHKKLQTFTFIPNLPPNTQKNPKLYPLSQLYPKLFLSHKKLQTFTFVVNLPLLTFPSDITINNYFLFFRFFLLFSFSFPFHFFPFTFNLWPARLDLAGFRRGQPHPPLVRFILAVASEAWPCPILTRAQSRRPCPHRLRRSSTSPLACGTKPCQLRQGRTLPGMSKNESCQGRARLDLAGIG